MHVVVVTIDIKPDAVERFLAAMVENAQNSLAHEAGCLRFDVIRDERIPNRIYLYEVYRDQAAFAAHMTMPHYLAWKETVKDWFAAPPVLGCGPNVFPGDADWDRRWKDR
jgi:quinol monooxygenase YgiN